MEMTSSNGHLERQPSHKATLYCPTCKHGSRINGDWLIQVHADYLDYECPECGATIDSRPDGSDLTTRSNGSLQPRNAD